MIHSLVDAYPFNTADADDLVRRLSKVKESLKHSFYPPLPPLITIKPLKLAQNIKRVS